MVGRLDSETRIRLIRLYLGMLDKDPERTVNVLIELGTLEPTVNRYIVHTASHSAFNPCMVGRSTEWR